MVRANANYFWDPTSLTGYGLRSVPRISLLVHIVRPFKDCCGWQNRQSGGNWPEKRGGQAWKIITDQVSGSLTNSPRSCNSKPTIMHHPPTPVSRLEKLQNIYNNATRGVEFCRISTSKWADSSGRYYAVPVGSQGIKQPHGFFGESLSDGVVPAGGTPPVSYTRPDLDGCGSRMR